MGDTSDDGIPSKVESTFPMEKPSADADGQTLNTEDLRLHYSISACSHKDISPDHLREGSQW